MKFFRENMVSIFAAAALLGIFSAQCMFPELTALLAVQAGKPSAWRMITCLLIHGSAIHVLINNIALIILLAGFGRRTSIELIATALPAVLASVWIYVCTAMPAHAWLCGASPLIFALFGLIAWRERKTSVFSLFGLHCLSLPPVPMLGVVLLCDALFASLLFNRIAWPIHVLAGLGGLLTGMFLSIRLFKTENKERTAP